MNRRVQRFGGGTASIISILLLAIGVFFGWRIHQGNQDTLRDIAKLNALNDRIWIDVLQGAEAIQAMSIEPKSETARKRERDAQSDLAGAIDSLQSAFPDRPEILSAARGLHALHNSILEQADSDPSAAAAAYRRNYLLLQEQRAALLKSLNNQAEQVVLDRTARDRQRELLDLGGIGLVLLAAVLLLCLKTAATAKPLAGLTLAIDRIRRGDFSRRLELDGTDDFGRLGEGVNGLAAELSTLIGRVQKSGLEVNATANHLAATAQEQQDKAARIAETTAEMGAQSGRISDASRTLGKTIEDVAQAAEQAGDLAGSGHSAVARMESGMRLVMEASGSVAARLSLLNDKTTAIHSVVNSIAKVADQTNLLSLNAAIEAEKAGEYGLGFAVVAMEIRRLADQTAVATYDIEKSVKEMQSAVAGSVMDMGRFSEEIRRGAETVREVGAQLAGLVEQVRALAAKFRNINEGIDAQAAGAQRMGQTLSALSAAAQETADALRHSNLTATQLQEAARVLRDALARYSPAN
jgi:methyl-accepting chemotaxis protein WspA